MLRERCALAAGVLGIEPVAFAIPLAALIAIQPEVLPRAVAAWEEIRAAWAHLPWAAATAGGNSHILPARRASKSGNSRNSQAVRNKVRFRNSGLLRNRMTAFL